MTSSDRIKSLFMLSPLVLVLMVAIDDSGVAQAQEEATGVLEEVIVTGRKREENLQDVPAAVVAISSETIERANISSARDITTRVPNVSIVESLSPTSTYIIVRGIASTRNSEPAVSMVVDGVQVGSATEISQSYYDVEQIELLKGPQGSLYGRNALGGALIINSKKPADEMEGRVSIGAGGDGWFELNGSLSAPVSENLFLRFAGNHKSYDGSIENQYLNRVLGGASRANTGEVPGSSPMDFEENNDYRVQMLWYPSDKTSVNLSYSNNDLEAGSMWYRNIYRMESDANVEYEFPVNSQGNPTAIRTIDNLTAKVDFETDLGTITSISNVTDTSERYGVAGETRGHDRTGNVLFYTGPFVSEFLDGLTNQVDIDFFTATLGGWADNTFVGSDQYYDVKTVSQELRIVSSADSSLRYVGGLFAMKTDRDDTIRATWELPFGAPFDCAPSYPGGPIITDFGTCSGLINSTQNSQDNLAWAAFMNVDYDFNDELTLTVAARYDSDEREITRIDGPSVDTFGLGVGACDSVADPDNCAASGGKLKRTFDEFQPKVSLSYQPGGGLANGDATLYATYATGFRSGGFNASGATLTDSYDAEQLSSYELGFKWSGLDGRIRADFAAFYQDYENAQQFEFDGDVFVQSLYNIPESEITGLEGSIDFAISESLLLSAAFGFMDSEIKRFDADILATMESELNVRVANTVKLPGGTQAAFDAGFVGYKLPLFAHRTANIALQHETPLAFLDGRYMTTRIDYSYSGDLNWWIDNEDIRDSVTLLEANIGFEIAENLELQAWCKNCTDEVYDSEFGSNERELFGGAAKDVAYQARGRTYGIRATYRF